MLQRLDRIKGKFAAFAVVDHRRTVYRAGTRRVQKIALAAEKLLTGS